MKKNPLYPKLMKAIQGKGLKLSYVSSAIGLTYKQFYLRSVGTTDFTLSEMRGLSKLLGESMDYLFN